MKAGIMVAAIVLVLPVGEAAAQSSPMLDYCKSLTATYRKAIADGKEPVAGAGQAIADCPTNTMVSVATLESALKKLNVKAPSRP